MKFALWLVVALVGLTLGAQVGPVTVTLGACLLVAGWYLGYRAALSEHGRG